MVPDADAAHTVSIAPQPSIAWQIPRRALAKPLVYHSPMQSVARWKRTRQLRIGANFLLHFAAPRRNNFTNGEHWAEPMVHSGCETSDEQLVHTILSVHFPLFALRLGQSISFFRVRTRTHAHVVVQGPGASEEWISKSMFSWTPHISSTVRMSAVPLHVCWGPSLVHSCRVPLYLHADLLTTLK